MTLPLGQDQECISGVLGPCKSSANMPQGRIALMPEAMGVRMRNLPQGQIALMHEGGGGAGAGGLSRLG